MAHTAREIFVAGLRNAHAMETQARELMERQLERLDEYPEVKAKVIAHQTSSLSDWSNVLIRLVKKHPL
jgi:ferritin-like metal-binding protein YciE